MDVYQPNSTIHIPGHVFRWHEGQGILISLAWKPWWCWQHHHCRVSNAEVFRIICQEKQHDVLCTGVTGNFRKLANFCVLPLCIQTLLEHSSHQWLLFSTLCCHDITIHIAHDWSSSKTPHCMASCTLIPKHDLCCLCSHTHRKHTWHFVKLPILP